MKKFALLLAAIATMFIAAPSSNAEAQTVVIKRGHHHHGARAQVHHPRGMHRGRGHGSKVIVVKKRYHRY